MAVDLLLSMKQDAGIVIFQATLLLTRLGTWADDNEREAFTAGSRVIAIPTLSNGVGGDVCHGDNTKAPSEP